MEAGMSLPTVKEAVDLPCRCPRLGTGGRHGPQTHEEEEIRFLRDLKTNDLTSGGMAGRRPARPQEETRTRRHLGGDAPRRQQALPLSGQGSGGGPIVRLPCDLRYWAKESTESSGPVNAA
jgi:hypothetical protein